MDSYINLIRNIIKDFKYSSEFDDIIKRILDKIFNNYYDNRKNIFIILIIYIKSMISQNITL